MILRWMYIQWFNFFLSHINIVRNLCYVRRNYRSGVYHNESLLNCAFTVLLLNASEAGGDITWIQISLLFSLKCKLVSIRTA